MPKERVAVDPRDVGDDGELPARVAATAVSLLRGIRPKQWLKNLLVFAAPMAAGALFEPPVLAGSLVAFVAFCLAASGTYLVNDIRDREMDRAHPVKSQRPIASGDLSVSVAAVAAVLLLCAAVALAFLQATALGWTVLGYVVATLSYSMLFKHEPVLELALLSMGFMLRAIAGGAATGLPLSSWFLIVAGFGSLFMAAGKRFSELARVTADNHVGGRRVLDSYSLDYLRFVWGMAAGVTLIAYCLWAFEVGDAGQSPPWSLLSIFPLAIGLLRYAQDIDGATAEAPEETVLGDRVLLISGGCWLVLFALGALAG